MLYLFLDNCLQRSFEIQYFTSLLIAIPQSALTGAQYTTNTVGIVLKLGSDVKSCVCSYQKQTQQIALQTHALCYCSFVIWLAAVWAVDKNRWLNIERQVITGVGQKN